MHFGATCRSNQALYRTGVALPFTSSRALHISGSASAANYPQNMKVKEEIERLANGYGRPKEPWVFYRAWMPGEANAVETVRPNDFPRYFLTQLKSAPPA